MSDQICILSLFSIFYLFVYTNVLKSICKCFCFMFLLGIKPLEKQKPSERILMVLVFLILKFDYNKSSTKEGNNPKAIFKSIEITATA